MPPRASKARIGNNRDVPASADRNAAACVREIKQRLKTLEARDVALIESRKRIEHERAEVAVAIEQAEAELEAVVDAPVVGEGDPTLWLPDELMLMILIHVVFVESSAVSNGVCQRWRRLCQDRSVIEASAAPWHLYAEGKQQPRVLKDKAAGKVTRLCAGPNGIMYCGTEDGSIQVRRSDKDGSLLQTLTGHVNSVYALAVGVDGTLYSSSEHEIRVWSGETGAHIRTLEGPHIYAVGSLVVNEATLFSGDDNGTICVWQCSTGDLVHTLTGVGGTDSLAQGNQNQVYSGTNNGTIHVWSTTDYTLIRTLEGHRGTVLALLLDKNGTLFSGSTDHTVRVWSGTDGSLLRTLEGHTKDVTSLAISPNGTLFSASEDTIRFWHGGGRTSRAVAPRKKNWFLDIAFTRGGHLWVAMSSLHVYS